MMRCLGATLILFGIAAAPMGAAETGFRTSRAGVRQEVIAVIEEQLAAFRQGDVAKAYACAAAAVRGQNSERRFAAIVRENYPEIWANRGADYGLVHDDGTHATVRVFVSSKAGRGAYDYVLIRERAGWRIGSVMHHDPRRKSTV